ncbi:molecular chaperone DnaK [Microbacterium sp. Leaf288]|nr:molecular chaperone DnaK [Microbacterium sp. Leaf288]
MDTTTRAEDANSPDVTGGDLRGLLEILRLDAADRLSDLDIAMGVLLASRGVDVADDEHDPEGVTLSAEWSRSAGLREAARKELEQIDDALRRLNAGGYGVCADCGEPIPIARLRVRPFASRCVSCAERAGT